MFCLFSSQFIQISRKSIMLAQCLKWEHLHKEREGERESYSDGCLLYELRLTEVCRLTHPSWTFPPSSLCDILLHKIFSSARFSLAWCFLTYKNSIWGSFMSIAEMAVATHTSMNNTFSDAWLILVTPANEVHKNLFFVHKNLFCEAALKQCTPRKEL